MACLMDFAKEISSTDEVIQINSWNKCVGHVDLETAVENDLVFAVAPKECFFVGDYDQETGLIDALAAVRALQQLELSPVILRSHTSSNRAHLFVRVDDLKLKTKVIQILQAAKAWRGHSHIRPPLSRHRDSGYSELVYPANSDLALKWLNGKKTTSKSASQTMTKKLSEYVPKGTRSEHIFGLTVLAVKEGFGIDAWIEAAQNHPKIRKRSKAKREEYLFETLVKVLRTYRDSEQKPEITQWLAHINKISIPVRFQRTLREVAALVENTNKTTVHLSIRNTAEIAGYSKDTAKAHLSKLCELGLLKRTIRHGYSKGYEYTICVPKTLQTQTLNSSPVKLERYKRVVSKNVTFKDAFSRCQVLSEVFLTLSNDAGISSAALAQQLGMKVPAVMRHIRRLLSWNLIERRGRLYFAVENPDFDSVSKVRGTNGVSELRVQLHKLQRFGYEQRVQKHKESGGHRYFKRYPRPVVQPEQTESVVFGDQDKAARLTRKKVGKPLLA